MSDGLPNRQRHHRLGDGQDQVPAAGARPCPCFSESFWSRVASTQVDGTSLLDAIDKDEFELVDAAELLSGRYPLAIGAEATRLVKAAKEALKRNAPNQNKYVVNIADRVKRRRDRKKPDRLGFLDDRIKATQRHGTKTKGDSGETRRAKSAKAKTSAREAKFEQQRKKSNVTMLPYRKRKQNPGVKAPKPMQY